MRIKISIMIICLLICISGGVLAASSSTADPTEIGVGARPMGLGKAYVGFSEDSNSIFINPAGIADIDGLKINSMSGQLIQDLNYIVLDAAYPYNFGTMGFGFINVGLPSIPITTVTGSGTMAAVVPSGATDYNASVIAVSYGNDLDTLPLLSRFDHTKYGINFKYYTQGFTGGGVTMEGANGSGFDMDIGLQYSPNDSFVFGVSAINFLPESMGGKFTWVKDNVTENIPMVIKVGTKTKLFGKENSVYDLPSDIYLGVDADVFPVQLKPTVLHVGTEWWPTEVLALRLGIDQKPKATESGVGVDNNLTVGIGLRSDEFTFDYCYHQYSDLADNVTHYFSIGYIGTEKKVPKLVDEPKVILPVIIPRPNLKAFSDVPDGYWAKGPIEFMATLGVMDGYGDGTFKPEKPVSRAELSKILIILKEMEPNELSYDPYPDVPRSYWAAKYIRAASFLKFMGAYPDGTFKPEQLVSRAEGVITLTRFESLKVPRVVDKQPYTDVPKWHWAAGAITIAKRQGYLDYLNADRQFEVNRLLTRAELAEMLSKTEYGRKRIRNLLED